MASCSTTLGGESRDLVLSSLNLLEDSKHVGRVGGTAVGTLRVYDKRDFTRSTSSVSLSGILRASLGGALSCLYDVTTTARRRATGHGIA